MARPLPRWIMISYAKLWHSHKGSTFDFSQAQKLIDKRHTSVVLSFLKKRGWLEITLHPKDSRKRLYTLKSPEQAIGEMANE